MSDKKKGTEILRVFNFNRYEEDIVSLKPGSYVKVNYNKECFWVELTECSGAEPIKYHADGHYLFGPTGPTFFKGKVSNNLVCGEPGFGEIIEFDLSHIVGTT
jgi:hypothetical protein